MVTAVNDVSLTVPEGAIFGFPGPNGAGKTITIRLLTGVLTPDSGTVRINGIDIHRHPLTARMQMGVIPESSKQSLSCFDICTLLYSYNLRRFCVMV